MEPSKNILQVIETLEGKSSKAYRDIGGVWTIGIGCVVKPENDIYLATVLGTYDYDLMSIELTDDQIYHLYKLKHEEILNSVKIILSKRRIHLTQEQFDAVCSFAFNLGSGNLASSTLLKKLEQEDFDGAASEFLKWKFVNKKFYQGILNRRIIEMNIFLTKTKFDDIIIDTSLTRVKDRNFIRNVVRQYRGTL